MKCSSHDSQRLKTRVTSEAPGRGWASSQGWLCALCSPITLLALCPGICRMWVMGTGAHVSTNLQKPSPEGLRASGVQCSPSRAPCGRASASGGPALCAPRMCWEERELKIQPSVSPKPLCLLVISCVQDLLSNTLFPQVLETVFHGFCKEPPGPYMIERK